MPASKVKLRKDETSKRKVRSKLDQLSLSMPPSKNVQVKVTLPRDMSEAISALADSRGCTVSDFIRLSLRGIMRRHLVYGLKTELGFGKYQGETLMHVIQCDPSYVDWALGNMASFSIDDESKRLLDTITDPASHV